MKSLYNNGVFSIPTGTEMTPLLLTQAIKEHKSMLKRYERLKNLYEGNHSILSAANKDSYKPDNRLVANFAKYIVDTLNGFFIGIPIKIDHKNKDIADYLEYIDSYNDQDNNNSELSKMCSIYGHAYELLFTDEEANICLTHINPLEAFVIYDNSIVKRPMYGVRYYTDNDGNILGSFSSVENITYFHDDGGLIFDETVPHYFGGVPLIEYIENEERQGAFENVETLINAYNKAISEKANDTDYYADAYLKIIGASLGEETLSKLRDSRIINIEGSDSDKVIVEFLSKPNADTTQENLINRLEQLIFHLSMVANINDKDFGNASGISLKYKLQSMNNLAKTKERKFVSGLNKRYKLICNCPASKLNSDDWIGINYQFTRNMPSNLLEESQIAGNLAGIVSEETQIKILSCVDNVKQEIDKKREENVDKIDSFQRGNDDTYKITSILNKLQKGSITEVVAKKMLKNLGLNDEDIQFYLTGGMVMINE